MIYNDVDAFFVSKIINKINQLKNLNIEYQGLKINTSLSSVSMIFSDCLRGIK
ncbi:hypothetical protein [Bathymodiolus japonicus methanotrophic gill symbiont]|uniref:hypothetical protein n=1 Tax=Bathymodiolus japonicus methanotrophic gill symbiont TaxID=113269 RepID=UPI001C8DB7C5|nr:hypothetical protein [Bathymodiolus japonicus methanotrophic gill symbiont]